MDSLEGIRVAGSSLARHEPLESGQLGRLTHVGQAFEDRQAWGKGRSRPNGTYSPLLVPEGQEISIAIR